MPSNPNRPYVDAVNHFRANLYPNISSSEGVPKKELYVQLRLLGVGKKDANEIIDIHLELDWLKKEGSTLYAVDGTVQDLSARKKKEQSKYEKPEPYALDKPDRPLKEEEAMSIIENA
jgi:kynurenine formamidase